MTVGLLPQGQRERGDICCCLKPLAKQSKGDVCLCLQQDEERERGSPLLRVTGSCPCPREPGQSLQPPEDVGVFQLVVCEL